MEPSNKGDDNNENVGYSSTKKTTRSTDCPKGICMKAIKFLGKTN